MSSPKTRALEILRRLSLLEKCQLLAGRTPFHLQSFPEKGVPEIIVTDGPLGVRTMPREREPERIDGPATAMPCSTAQAAAFSPELVHEMAAVLAEEVRALGCDLLLAPGVNIARDPRSGRTFEYFSEDPLLSAVMGAAFVRGLQDHGVGACVKHFVANDLETNRFNSSSEMDERTLREIHLFPFEWIAREARPWSLMPAYNKLNGVHCTEHAGLLGILREECGFDGAMISDWGAVHTCEESVAAGCDLQMPGPGIQRGDLLVHAVQFGKIPLKAVDACALRVIELILRCADGRARHVAPRAHTPEHADVSRRVAEAGAVLLKNEGAVLPLDARKVRSVALIGPNGAVGCLRGGGSSRVFPEHWASLAEGLRRLLGPEVELLVEPGCTNEVAAPIFQGPDLARPSDGKPGFDAEYFNSTDCTGTPVFSEQVAAVDKSFLKPELKNLAGRQYSARFTAEWTVPRTGRHLFTLLSRDHLALFVDDEPAGLSIYDPDGFAHAAVERVHRRFEAGRKVRLRVEFYRRMREPLGGGNFNLGGMFDPPKAEDDRLDRALDAARRSDAVILALGNPNQYESEGFDRPDLKLTGRQDELAASVLALRPDAAVVLSTGAPVEMPWLEKARSVLLTHLSGQRGGDAAARLLFGVAAPCGRLPLTWPKRLEDLPSWPSSGVYNVVYGEHVFAGYRGFDIRKTEPLFPFGHGLTYTTFACEELRVPSSPARGLPFTVRVAVRNTGALASAEVVQIYAAPETTLKLPCPIRRLAGFARTPVLAPGEVRLAEVRLDPSAFGFYDPAEKSWVYPAGPWRVEAARSSRDIATSTTVTFST